MRHGLTGKLVLFLGGDLNHQILPFIEVVGKSESRGPFSHNPVHPWTQERPTIQHPVTI